MSSITYREVTNLIRERCGIKVSMVNKDKFVLNKEEQVVILSYILQLETKVARQESDDLRIDKIVNKVYITLKREGVI